MDIPIFGGDGEVLLHGMRSVEGVTLLCEASVLLRVTQDTAGADIL